jgi:predicted protein tyrosine phosphatase
VTRIDETESLRHTCVEVVEDVWIGGEAAAVPETVRTVITLEGATPPLELADVTEHRFPLLDTRWEPVAHEPLAAAVETVVDRDAPVLVRCRHGVNRSALVVCLALRREGHGWTEVVALVRGARPRALTNPYFLDLVAIYPEDPMSPG